MILISMSVLVVLFCSSPEYAAELIVSVQLGLPVAFSRVSDIYSMSLVMFEILCGASIVPDVSSVEMLLLLVLAGARPQWPQRPMAEAMVQLLRAARSQPWPREPTHDEIGAALSVAQRDDIYHHTVPACMIALVEKCWSPKGSDRPTANQVCDYIKAVMLIVIRSDRTMEMKAAAEAVHRVRAEATAARNANGQPQYTPRQIEAMVRESQQFIDKEAMGRGKHARGHDADMIVS